MIETIVIIAIAAVILGTVYYNVNRKDTAATTAELKPATVSTTAKSAKKAPKKPAAKKPAVKKPSKKATNKKA